jgi:hypothetical protein
MAVDSTVYTPSAAMHTDLDLTLQILIRKLCNYYIIHTVPSSFVITCVKNKLEHSLAPFSSRTSMNKQK